jgi:hypothetical protein
LKEHFQPFIVCSITAELKSACPPWNKNEQMMGEGHEKIIDQDFVVEMQCQESSKKSGGVESCMKMKRSPHWNPEKFGNGSATISLSPLASSGSILIKLGERSGCLRGCIHICRGYHTQQLQTNMTIKSALIDLLIEKQLTTD